VAQPTTQLNATEQDTLVKQIGLALLRAAPREWQRVSAEYRAVGRYHEMTGEIITNDGAAHEWVATHDIASLFGRLRAGMYRDGRGTWFNARYQLDHPSSYNLEYDREEPEWDMMPPPQAYADELRMFPRSEENVPEWLMRRMSGLAPEQPGPRFRIARIFDGASPNGRPVINRPELDMSEQERLLEYLDQAPVALSERGYDLDRLAGNPTATVPVAFHTDGEWMWPAAVNFYLREYGVAPEADLVQHIRSRGFTIPEVSEQTRQSAAAFLTRGNNNPPPRPGPPPAPEQQGMAPPQRQEEQQSPREPLESAVPPPFREAEPPYDRHFGQNGSTEPPPLTAQAAREDDVPAHAAAEGGPPTQLVSPPPAAPKPPEHPTSPAQPGPPAPVSAGPGRPSSPVLDQLRTKLDELDVPGSAYRIGGPAERGWSIEEVDEGWRVGLYDGDLTSPAVFGDPEDAAAFMLGKLMLDRDGSGRATRAQAQAQASPTPPVPQAPAAQEPPPQANRKPSRPKSLLATLPADVATGTRQVPSQGGEPADSPSGGRPGVDGAPRSAVEADGGPQTQLVSPPVSDPMPGALSERLDETSRPGRPMGGPGGPGPGGPGSPNGRGGPGGPGGPGAPPPRREPPQAAPPGRDEGPRSGSGSGSGAGSGSGEGGQSWPIQPMPGEPPLTLFRGKEVRELPAGSELDRFGNPNGNLTYAAGTPFEERSLVPEWVNRPYHVYRVQRPLEALAGVAIPWFNQPGGGAAYLLPASVEELLADGDLIELDPGDPPID
jgi:hypothetical protein